MSASLPVPSKGAIRTLRRLALGTSCTIALGAGVLTEDRRRRIRVARQVHDNARRLKASSQYHNSGPAAIKAFEDHATRHPEEAPWLPSNISQSTAFAENAEPCSTEEVHEPNRRPQTSSAPATPRIPRDNIPLKDTAPEPVHHVLANVPSSHIPAYTVREARKTRVVCDSRKCPGTHAQTRQNRSASKIKEKLLKDPASVISVNEALTCFLATFEEGFPTVNIDCGITESLLVAAQQLARACHEQQRDDDLEKILDVVLRSGPMNESDFYLLYPDSVIRRLIKKQRYARFLLDATRLKKASSIYLTRFKERPIKEKNKEVSLAFFRLGETLCRESCRSKMFDLTSELYFRRETYRTSQPNRSIIYLIAASHGQGKHKEAVRYFLNFYSESSPGQRQFWGAGNLVIDSVLRLGLSEKAEEVLEVATQMARTGGLTTSTTWLLKVIKYEWGSNRDVTRACELFERLVKHLDVAAHPQAVYSAIIQRCVEGDEEPLALSYFERLQEIHLPSLYDLRIHGHFALAKARRQDWEGVIDDFQSMQEMRQYSAEKDDGYDRAFTPIWKQFADTHPVDATESFLRFFIGELGIKLNKIMMNIMIGKYARARETESMSRWIQFASNTGLELDAYSFNIMLNSCLEIPTFSFSDAFRLVEAVQALRSDLVNEVTVRKLRHVASAYSRDAIQTSQRLRITDEIEKQLPVGSHGNEGRKVHDAMAASLSTGQPVATLKTYNQAEADYIPLGPEHLLLAVRASLQIHGDNLAEPLRYVNEGQQKGWNVSASLVAVFTYRIRGLHEEGKATTKEITQLAQDTISALEARKVQIPLTVLTETASIMEQRGHYSSAIDFWDSATRRLGLLPSSLDVPMLTVILKCYIGLQSAIGVQWIVKMLSDHNLFADKHLRMLLKNARRGMAQLFETTPCGEDKHQFYDALVDAIQVTKEMGEEARAQKEYVAQRTMQIIEQAVGYQVATNRKKLEERPEPQESHNFVDIGMDVEGGLVAMMPWEEVVPIKSRHPRESYIETGVHYEVEHVVYRPHVVFAGAAG